MTSSFGRPEHDGEEPDGSGTFETPTPVLHVGEVHAELRLTITEDTLRHLGSQIASMVAAATRQGFEHGLAAAMEQLGDDSDEDGGSDGAASRT